MDADTRHQLKQNELAEALGRLRDWDNPSTRYTLMGLLVIVVLFASWKWFGYTHRRGAEQSWERLANLQTALASADELNARRGAAKRYRSRRLLHLLRSLRH